MIKLVCSKNRAGGIDGVVVFSVVIFFSFIILCCGVNSTVCGLARILVPNPSFITQTAISVLIIPLIALPLGCGFQPLGLEIE